jgi:ubiquinone/menaquinone biosynthesis C-methylase UbiE
MNSVHRFDGKVADYDLYRERYSPEVLLPVLRERCGLSAEWIIADIGAGTGMLSDVFLSNGNRVVAIEPNAEMRQACRELHSDSQLEVLEGTAENTGLAAVSIDMVTAGRAMHWFDLQGAMKEFRRVLKPEGWVAIVAFGRTEQGHKENVAIEQVLRRFSEDGKDTHAGYTVYQNLREYIPRNFYHQQITSTILLSWEKLHGLVMSFSASPRREDTRYPAFEQELRSVFELYECDGEISLEMRYWINLGQFA